MKRGKDDEKILGPMFPRLHVNDTDKGGPRAPPRNKMALYEQLTIPSQRYATPPKQNNSSKSVPSTSTSQGPSSGRNTYFPLYQPPSAPAYDAGQALNAEGLNSNNRPPSAPAYDASQALNAEGLNSNNQRVHVENKKKPLEEDDFMVPIFSEAGTAMHNDKSQNSIEREGQGLLRTTAGDGTNFSNYGLLLSKQQLKDQEGSTLRVSASTRSSLDISMGGRDDIPPPNDVSLPREHQEKHRLGSLENTGLYLLEGHRDSLPAVDAMMDEDVHDQQTEDPCKDTSLSPRLNPQTHCEFSGADEIENGIDLEKENIDRGDDVSETSMVDCASEFDVTPDDVVDILGRSHFWKARTAIVNQQRVFAFQVFELHRLLKVQKYFAGSPNLLLEATAFVGQVSLKRPAAKKYSPEYVVKVLPLKDATHRATDDVEGTAENAVPKAATPVLPQHHPTQSVDYTSFSSNTVFLPPGSMDPKMNPWGFHLPSSQQWLVPVMTPSEGLVYKLYPAPGFAGPVCGGCGPTGNFMNPPFQQGMGMPPGIHFGGQGYFPPYGIQMMNSSVSGSTVEHFTPYSQVGQSEEASLNHGAEHKRPRAPEQGSTASSPSDRVLRIETLPHTEGRDANRLSAPPPTTEVPMDTAHAPREKQARVIRAVPHRSASDSATRIFLSIQQERQLYESS
ncbi:hypothetical protein RND81_08G196200 [Saponaria officinalis]|uniref:Protein EARLY FLOWERING 3 n=1 Tax=Saponaria officinalis TaxID=3572 RepID=A0AAW1J9Z0_SAPOF